MALSDASKPRRCARHRGESMTNVQHHPGAVIASASEAIQIHNSVIPGRCVASNPESITTIAGDGFRICA
jgi:hypothetical protein